MFKTQIFYIQIKENTFIIRSIDENKTTTVKAQTPFSTQRLLIGQFSVAEELLNTSLQQFKKALFLSPIIIMHPLENIDETLSEVEEKVFKEVALSVGAREVKLWVGEELSDEDLSTYLT